MRRIMATIILSTYILLKVLLKYLNKATDANSIFLIVKMTIELKHQTQVENHFLWRIRNSDNAENTSLFDGKVFICLNSKVKQF